MILTAKAYSLLSYARLSKLKEIAEHIESTQLEGSFVELGVCNGGSAGMIAWPARNNHSRKIWLFDSWEGLPEPTEHDVRISSGNPGAKGLDLGYEENVRDLLFRRLKLNENSIRLVKGWYEDTIPKHKDKIGKIALLHLDCDWYESVKLCLNELYELVVEGGYIIIDDYGHWEGCRKAVDEFFAGKNINPRLIPIDGTGYYLQKQKE